MRRFLAALLILTNGSAFAASVPSVELELYRIPKGIFLEHEGVAFRAFTFEEWKQLLIVDTDLKSRTLINGRQVKLIASLRDECKSLDAQVKLENGKYLIAEAERGRLNTLWEETDKKLKKCQAGGLFKSVPLLLGGILAVAGGVVLLTK